MPIGPYGAGSEDSMAFFLTIYHLTEQVPKGKVTTYGHLAYLAGKPSNARQAGQALKLLPSDHSVRYNTGCVPWWRVINSSGRISNIENRDLQAELLANELDCDQPFNLAKFGWFPEPESVDLDFEVYESS